MSKYSAYSCPNPTQMRVRRADTKQVTFGPHWRGQAISIWFTCPYSHEIVFFCNLSNGIILKGLFQLCRTQLPPGLRFTGTSTSKLDLSVSSRINQPEPDASTTKFSFVVHVSCVDRFFTSMVDYRINFRFDSKLDTDAAECINDWNCIL